MSKKIIPKKIVPKKKIVIKRIPKKSQTKDIVIKSNQSNKPKEEKPLSAIPPQTLKTAGWNETLEKKKEEQEERKNKLMAKRLKHKVDKADWGNVKKRDKNVKRKKGLKILQYSNLVQE